MICLVLIQNNIIPIGCYFNMSYLLEYWSDRSEIWNTCWLWSLDHVYQKSEFFKNSFSFLIKTAYFTQKMKFLYTSRYFDLLSILFKSFVWFDSKTQKNKTFWSRYMINNTRFAFFDFDMSSQKSQFFISVTFKNNFNRWTWFDCPIASYLYHIFLTLVYFS